MCEQTQALQQCLCPMKNQDLLIVVRLWEAKIFPLTSSKNQVLLVLIMLEVKGRFKDVLQDPLKVHKNNPGDIFQHYGAPQW